MESARPRDSKMLTSESISTPKTPQKMPPAVLWSICQDYRRALSRSLSAFVCKIQANIRTFGSHTALRTIPLGRSPTNTAALKAGTYLEDRPSAYQDEMQLHLHDDCGVRRGSIYYIQAAGVDGH